MSQQDILEKLKGRIEFYEKQFNFEKGHFQPIPEITASFTDPEVKYCVDLINNIEHKSNMILKVVAKKKLSLLKEINYSLEKKNYLWLAEAIRTLFEILGTDAHFAQQVNKVCLVLESPKSTTQILSELKLLSDKCNILLTTTGINAFTKYGNKKFRKEAINPAVLLASYCEYLSEHDQQILNDSYVYLSEVVHPNILSTLLASKQPEHLISGSEQIHKECYEIIMQSLTFIINAPISVGLDIALTSKILDYKNIAIQRATMSLNELFKITNTDTLKQMSGDGKSKETAFSFPNSRSHIESIDFVNEYAEKNQLTDRLVQSVEENYLFETYKKGNKLIWFKYKMAYAGEI